MVEPVMEAVMEAAKLRCTALGRLLLRDLTFSTSLSACDRVFVADSTIKGAGQGLFAKTDADKDTVMAFYNGVRITHSEVGAGDDGVFTN